MSSSRDIANRSWSVVVRASEEMTSIMGQIRLSWSVILGSPDHVRKIRVGGIPCVGLSQGSLFGPGTGRDQHMTFKTQFQTPSSKAYCQLFSFASNKMSYFIEGRETTFGGS